MALLGLVVANVDLGSELHFLDLDLGLVLTSSLGLHGLLVLELTVVHDLADRRLRVGSDLDQVETLIVSDALGIADGEQAELRAIDANQTARRCSDLVVDAGVIRLSYFPYLHS